MHAPPGPMDNLYGLLTVAAPPLIPIDDRVDYFTDTDDSIGSRAARNSTDPMYEIYDRLITNRGQGFARLSSPDPADNEQAVFEMLQHPDTIAGLSDAGAHVTMICDGSSPSLRSHSRSAASPEYVGLSPKFASNHDLRRLLRVSMLVSIETVDRHRSGE
ncbi:MAG: hypothetical protein AB8G14_10465 [Ilumatobacter sp.]